MPLDPKYVKLAQARPDHLDRRFEAVKDRSAELLPVHVEVADSGVKATPVAAGEQQTRVTLYKVR